MRYVLLALGAALSACIPSAVGPTGTDVQSQLADGSGDASASNRGQPAAGVAPGTATVVGATVGGVPAGGVLVGGNVVGGTVVGGPSGGTVVGGIAVGGVLVGDTLVGATVVGGTVIGAQGGP